MVNASSTLCLFAALAISILAFSVQRAAADPLDGQQSISVSASGAAKGSLLRDARSVSTDSVDKMLAQLNDTPMGDEKGDPKQLQEKPKEDTNSPALVESGDDSFNELMGKLNADPVPTSDDKSSLNTIVDGDENATAQVDDANEKVMQDLSDDSKDKSLDSTLAELAANQNDTASLDKEIHEFELESSKDPLSASADSKAPPAEKEQPASLLQREAFTGATAPAPDNASLDQLLGQLDHANGIASSASDDSKKSDLDNGVASMQPLDDQNVDKAIGALEENTGDQGQSLDQAVKDLKKEQQDSPGLEKELQQLGVQPDKSDLTPSIDNLGKLEGDLHTDETVQPDSLLQKTAASRPDQPPSAAASSRPSPAPAPSQSHHSKGKGAPKPPPESSSSSTKSSSSPDDPSSKGDKAPKPPTDSPPAPTSTPRTHESYEAKDASQAAQETSLDESGSADSVDASLNLMIKKLRDSDVNIPASDPSTPASLLEDDDTGSVDNLLSDAQNPDVLPSPSGQNISDPQWLASALQMAGSPPPSSEGHKQSWLDTTLAQIGDKESPSPDKAWLEKTLDNMDAVQSDPRAEQYIKAARGLRLASDPDTHLAVDADVPLAADAN